MVKKKSLREDAMEALNVSSHALPAIGHTHKMWIKVPGHFFDTVWLVDCSLTVRTTQATGTEPDLPVPLLVVRTHGQLEQQSVSD